MCQKVANVLLIFGNSGSGSPEHASIVTVPGPYLARQALDRGYLGAVALDRQHQATTYNTAIHPHRAGATHTMLAAEMRPGQAEFTT